VSSRRTRRQNGDPTTDTCSEGKVGERSFVKYLTKSFRASQSALDRLKDVVTTAPDPSFASASMPHSQRYLWLRIALFERRLAIIVDFIVKNAK
jgi:hypothetical protein